MTEGMMKEILDDWNSWKYDIWEANKSTWVEGYKKWKEESND